MLKKRPYLVLWFLGAVLCVAFAVSYFFKFDKTFVLNFSDTSFGIAHSQLFLLFAVWLLLCGFGYFILHKYGITPIYSLTKLHVTFTLLTFFAVIGDQLLDKTSLETTMVWIAILLFPIAQIIYFMNIIAATVLNIQENAS